MERKDESGKKDITICNYTYNFFHCSLSNFSIVSLWQKVYNVVGKIIKKKA